MRLNRFCPSKKRYFYIILSVLSITIFYIELYSYYSKTSTWLKPSCKSSKDCTKILLVADPQLIGYKDEVFHFLTPLSVLDSDMYLKKTYSYAFNFAQPDIVIFLGDLMDEGSKASDDEFYSYVRRVFNLFLDHSQGHVKHIWLPGDNDIGGEGYDIVTSHKLKRFHRAFDQPDLIYHKNISFFKINALDRSVPVFKGKHEFYDVSRIFIGLSHVPLLFLPTVFGNKVIDKFLPHVLFTAHEHKSMIISMDALLRQDRQIIPVTPDNNNKIHQYSLGVTDMYEFIVPTCSYRMGTEKIGFGYAVLDKNELYYTVLWSPSRFRQLIVYLILLVILFLSVLCRYCCLKNAISR